MPSPATVARELTNDARPGDLKGAKRNVGPWSFVFSRPGFGQPDLFIFSAKMCGARSTDSDWHFMGALAAALGAPEDALQTDIGVAWTPDQAIFWMWHSNGVPYRKGGTPN